MKSFFLLLLSYYVISKHVSRKKKLDKALKHLRTQQFSVDNKSKVEENKTIESKNDSINVYKLPEEWPVKDGAIISMQELKAKLWRHNLTPGEIEQIYKSADRNKNNRLTPAEWAEFYKLFVKPFENCLQHNYSYTLKENELTNCLNEKYFRSIHAQLWKINSTTKIWTFMNKKEDNEFTFFDYLFLRRVNVAWELCVSLDKVAVSNLPCALHITSPGRKMEIGEGKQIYDVGLALNYGRNTIRGFMDLFTFIDVATIYMFYSEFDKPIMNGKLSKAELSRAVMSQQLPVDLTLDIIEEFFTYIDPNHSEIDEITFKEFCVFIHLWRLFYRYGTKNPKYVYMKYEDFYDALNSSSIYEGLIAEMNEIEFPNKTIYEAMKNESETESPTNEKLFLVEFLQTASAKKAHRHDLRRHATATKSHSQLNFNVSDQNSTAYKTMYTSFEGKGIGMLFFLDFLRFFKLSYCFRNMDVNLDGHLSGIEVRNQYQTCFPYMGFYLSESLGLQYMLSYLSYEKKLNLKNFVNFFNYKTVFSRLVVPSSYFHVDREGLKKGLCLMGLPYDDEVTQASKEGLDDTSESFNYEIAIKKSMDLESRAIEYEKIHFPKNETECIGVQGKK